MIVLALFLTALSYLIFPICYRCLKGKVCKKQGKKIALLNSIICFVIFAILTACTGGNVAKSGVPAFFYYFIAKAILIDKNLSNCEKNVCRNNEKDKVSYAVDEDYSAGGENYGTYIKNYNESREKEERKRETVEENGDRLYSNTYKKPLREITDRESANKLVGRNYISCGTEWRGKNQTDVINQVLGTSYKAWMKSGVPMKKFGLPDVISWFTYLTGNIHGTSDDYLWKNYLSKDEKIIQEKYVGNDVHFVEKRYREEKKLCRYRLVFQRDPENRGEQYRYRFLGWYKLKNVDFETGVHTFERVQKDGYLTDNPFEFSQINKPPIKIKNNPEDYIGVVVNPPVVIPNNPEDYIGAVVKNNKYGVGWIKGIKDGYFIVVFKGKEHKYTLSSINNGLTVIREENDNDDNI